ncbi:tRNA/rRNA methyltransferase SpoU [Luteitalea sp. TBR-22]|uniref:TrmH family RNA methyltransferase n=1 Tax=Luteitalea sp. TBR-22 TaxID=2802971 RepID=UPI001AFBB614|nr:RNA methyltransferase [Luteitalea sp. TBR-22]BCS33059.1 tRNA/rRNA methyltransferase SpoU [Luteitalea sp. TBR-22]
MPDSTITSRRHPLVARCRDAADGHGDDVLLDGPHLVGEALAGGLAVSLVLVAEGAEARSEIAALTRQAAARGVGVQPVTPAVLDAASPTRTPAGVLALASLVLRSPGELLAPSPALVTMAIDVQDPGNLGALVRSSEAAGATGVLAAGSSAHPLGWKALRGSMGSALRLPVAREASVRHAADALRAAGLRLVALDARATQDLYAADLTGPLAVCAGSEGAGLPADLLREADLRLRIPMRAPVESLNVAVATSLVLFEVARQRRESALGNRESRIGAGQA